MRKFRYDYISFFPFLFFLSFPPSFLPSSFSSHPPPPTISSSSHPISSSSPPQPSHPIPSHLILSHSIPFHPFLPFPSIPSHPIPSLLLIPSPPNHLITSLSHLIPSHLPIFVKKLSLNNFFYGARGRGVGFLFSLYSIRWLFSTLRSVCLFICFFLSYVMSRVYFFTSLSYSSSVSFPRTLGPGFYFFSFFFFCFDWLVYERVEGR